MIKEFSPNWTILSTVDVLGFTKDYLPESIVYFVLFFMKFR